MVLLELQEYIYELLSTLPYEVHDNVPKNTVCPYIEIGTSYGKDYSDKTRIGFKDYQYIDIYSKYIGQKEVKEIMQQVNALLQNKKFKINNTTIFLYLDESKILKQEDAVGYYTHGILIYKIITKG